MRACKHCGGEVMEDGYAAKMADGGEVEEVDAGEPMDGDGDEVRAPESRMGDNEEGGWELEQRQANEGKATEQQAGTERLRRGAFADAVQRMARGGKVLRHDKEMSESGRPAEMDVAPRPTSSAPGADRTLAPMDEDEMRDAVALKKRERALRMVR